jgi:hypothetical protein
LGSHVDLGAEVLECYSSFEDSAGSVLRKFRAQAEGELVQISIQTRINTVGERIDACQWLLVQRRWSDLFLDLPGRNPPRLDLGSRGNGLRNSFPFGSRF